MDDTTSLLPHRWTPIAERSRDLQRHSLLLWKELPKRVLSLPEAHALAAKGVKEDHSYRKVGFLDYPTVVERQMALDTRPRIGVVVAEF